MTHLIMRKMFSLVHFWQDPNSHLHWLICLIGLSSFAPSSAFRAALLYPVPPFYCYTFISLCSLTPFFLQTLLLLSLPGIVVYWITLFLQQYQQGNGVSESAVSTFSGLRDTVRAVKRSSRYSAGREKLYYSWTRERHFTKRTSLYKILTSTPLFRVR